MKKLSENIEIYNEKESFTGNRDGTFSIYAYHDDEPEAMNRIAPHRHTYYEVIFVKYGKGVHTIDFNDYNFQGPCLFLLHPANIHTINKEGSTGGGVLKFTKELFPADESQSHVGLCYNVFDDIDVLPVIWLKQQEANELESIFDQIYQTFRRNEPFSLEIIASFLRIFLLKIYAIKKSGLLARLMQNNDLLRFQRFQQLLEGNFKNYHEISFYAEKLAVTVRTLNNITGKISGRSPSELIKQRIVLEAKRLLHHSTLTIKEIAYEMGFEDSSYFIRFFKTNANASPQQYRKTET
jgi:AraC family transcriptional activator of pobA